MRSPRTSTPVTRVPSVTTRASAPVRTSPPRLSMKARAGSAYISCSGRSGSAIADAAAIGTEHLGEHADERRRERFVGRLVERRERQRLPEPGRQLLGLPALAQPPRHRHRRRRSATRPVRASARRAACSDGAIRRTDRRSRHDIAPTSAPRRAGAAAAAAPDIAAPNGCRRSRDTARAAPPDGARGPRHRCAQERERLRVAAKQHVLPVVHELAGDAIGEGCRPAAELGPRVEHEHAPSGLGERRRGRQAREAGADDDDVWSHLVLTTVRAGGRGPVRAGSEATSRRR